MPTVVESVYCKEVQKVVEAAAEDVDEPAPCITENPSFQPVCLHKQVLRVAYLNYRDQYGHMPEQDNPRYKILTIHV